MRPQRSSIAPAMFVDWLEGISTKMVGLNQKFQCMALTSSLCIFTKCVLDYHRVSLWGSGKSWGITFKSSGSVRERK
jgi:hypothetical protein